MPNGESDANLGHQDLLPNDPKVDSKDLYLRKKTQSNVQHDHNIHNKHPTRRKNL